VKWVKFIPLHASLISKSNSENYIEIRWFLTKLQSADKNKLAPFYGPHINNPAYNVICSWKN